MRVDIWYTLWRMTDDLQKFVSVVASEDIEAANLLSEARSKILQALERFNMGQQWSISPYWEAEEGMAVDIWPNGSGRERDEEHFVLFFGVPVFPKKIEGTLNYIRKTLEEQGINLEENEWLQLLREGYVITHQPITWVIMGKSGLHLEKVKYPILLKLGDSYEGRGYSLVST